MVVLIGVPVNLSDRAARQDNGDRRREECSRLIVPANIPRGRAVEFPSSRRAMVFATRRYSHAHADARLAGDSIGPPHAHCRADRIRQDAGGAARRARRALSRGPLGIAARRGARCLRVAAEGTQRRYPQESGDPAARDCRNGEGARPRSARHHSRRPDGRQRGARAGADSAHAAARAGHDAGVAVPPADRGTQPPDAAHGPDRDRGRDSRGHRRAARRASRVVARTPGGARRPAAGAGRAVGDTAPD